MLQYCSFIKYIVGAVCLQLVTKVRTAQGEATFRFHAVTIWNRVLGLNFKMLVLPEVTTEIHWFTCDCLLSLYHCEALRTEWCTTNKLPCLSIVRDLSPLSPHQRSPLHRSLCTGTVLVTWTA